MKIRKLEVMKHLQAAALLKEEDMNDELHQKKKKKKNCGSLCFGI